MPGARTTPASRRESALAAITAAFKAGDCAGGLYAAADYLKREARIVRKEHPRQAPRLQAEAAAHVFMLAGLLHQEPMDLHSPAAVFEAVVDALTKENRRA